MKNLEKCYLEIINKGLEIAKDESKDRKDYHKALKEILAKYIKD